MKNEIIKLIDKIENPKILRILYSYVKHLCEN